MVTTDLYGKPFQLKFVRPGQMLLFANVVCDPPLGQTTVVPFGETVRSASFNLDVTAVLTIPLLKVLR